MPIVLYEIENSVEVVRNALEELKCYRVKNASLPRLFAGTGANFPLPLWSRRLWNCDTGLERVERY